MHRLQAEYPSIDKGKLTPFLDETSEVTLRTVLKYEVEAVVVLGGAEELNDEGVVHLVE